MRKRIIQEINTEFDLLIERASSGEFDIEPNIYENYETTYPLIAGSKIFKGTKPTKVTFDNQKIVYVSTWKQVVAAIMDECISDPKNKKRLMDLRQSISGKKRKLISNSKDGMRSPHKVCSGLYMETHYDTETLLNVLVSRVLSVTDFNFTGIQISIHNK